MTERIEVAIVGGGPAGAATAALLAALGHEVLLLERTPRWRWRACGVFASPASIQVLRRLGLTDAGLERVAQPIPAMRVESRRGATFRLTYDGSGALADSAVGFDRQALDDLLLERAAMAGAVVRRRAQVDRVALDAARPRLAVAAERGAAPLDIEAAVVVGADGLRSIVGGSAGVAARPPYPSRMALTFHVAAAGAGAATGAGGDADTTADADARMLVLQDGYLGIAPVPGGRVNVGIVLGHSWSARLRREGATGVATALLAHAGLPASSVLDRVAGVQPVSARVRARAGDRWLLVGDAAGFLDPFTGEGIHRALVSAELAAQSIHELLRGRAGSRLIDYDAAMRARFATKDVVSRLVQGFLGRPALFEYAARRLAARAGIRDTMGRVIGDLEPARHALDPRFLAALLAP